MGWRQWHGWSLIGFVRAEISINTLSLLWLLLWWGFFVFFVFLMCCLGFLFSLLHCFFFFRISLDRKPQEAVLVLKVQDSVTSMAVDWIHQLLYWTSIEMGWVSVAFLDGSAHRRLIAGLDKPSAVAVDPLRGYEALGFCISF